VNITVNQVNIAPILDPISPQVVDEGSHLEFAVASSDFDNDSLTLIAEDLPANATFTDSGNGHGLFVFDPDYTQSGVYPVRFIVSDGALADTELVNITVNHINIAPVLDPIGSQVVDEGSHLEFVVTSSDFDNDSLTLTAEGLPVNAAFTDSGNGHGLLTFDPDSEVVSITVNNVNRAPVLDSIGSRSVIEGGHMAFLVTASDPDGDSLILFTENLPANANFTDLGDGTGTFEFDPDYTQSGLYYVTFKASDLDLVDSEVVEITVIDAGNQPPVLDSIGSKTVAEAETLKFRVGATDPDGTIPALFVRNNPANSTFVDSGNGAGAFTFAPNYDQAGVYVVTFVTTDGSMLDSELVEITVTETDRSPVLDSIGPRIVDEGNTLIFRVHAVDPDNDSLTLSAENLPSNAIFTDSGNGAGSFEFTPDYTQAGLYDVIFIASDGTLADSEAVQITVNEAGNQVPVLDSIGAKVVDEGQVLEFRVSATDADGDSVILDTLDVPLNATFVDSGNGAGSFTFNPDYTQAGAYSVTFIASDGSLADSEVVSITVNNVNRVPIADAGPDQLNVEADSLVSLDGSSSYDPDGDSIGYHWSQLSGPSVTLSDSNAIAPTFTPGVKGNYEFELLVDDGALLSLPDIVLVSVGNQAPVLDSIGAKTVDEGQVLEFRVSATDGDGDSIILSGENVPLNATFVDSGNEAGSFTFNPDYTQAGLYSVTFIASDGSLADSEVVSITVNDVNRVPIADAGPDQLDVEADSLVSLDGSGSYDPDGDSIGYHWSQASGPSVTLSDSNAITPTFTPSVKGNYEFELLVDDGALLSLPDTVLVSVSNQVPVLDSIGAKTVDEGQVLEFRVSATDADGDSMILSGENVPLNATFVDSGNGAGSFTFSPDYTQAGLYSVTFIASDGSLADSEVVSITVNDVNRAPIADAGPDQLNVEADSLVSLDGSSSYDPDGDSIGYHWSQVSGLSVILSDTNAVNPTFTPGVKGNYEFELLVDDGALLSLPDTVLVSVGNQAPVLDSIGAKTVDEGQVLEFKVSAMDADGDSVILSAENVPVNASFVDSGNGAGSFTFNPDYTQSGLYSVTFIVFDGGLADSEVVDITVNQVNIAPILDPIGAKAVDEGSHLEFVVTSSDFDNDSLILTAEDLPANAAFTDSGNGHGLLTFDPDSTQAGVYPVRFIVNDGALADTELVNITVNQVNLAPVLDPIGPQVTAEGSHLEFVVTSSDFDNDSLILTAEGLPANSAFTDSGNGHGLLTFDPDSTQAGVYPVRFIVSDGTLADTELVDITVNQVNIAPVLDPIGPQVVNEGSHLEFVVTSSDFDNDSLILTAEDLPANAAFTDSGNGHGSFTFDPDYTQAGIYNVIFIASDGSLSDSEVVSITVNDVNRAPIADAGPDQLNVEADSLVSLDGSSSYDPDGDSIGYHWSQVSGPSVTLSDSNAIVPTFTPGVKGNYEFELLVDDGALLSLPDTVLVSVGNQSPVLDSIGAKTVDEGQVLEFRVSATDGDGDSIILTAENVPVNATFVDSGNGAGSFTFNPDYTQAGFYSVTFIAFDGALADSEVVSITVNDVNRSPVLDSIGAKTVNEGQTLELRVSATDPDGDSITLMAEDVPVNATFVDSGNGAGSFTFNPDYTQAGIYSVTFIASDGVLIDSEIVEITVNEAGNQAPVLDSVGSEVVDEGETLEFRVSATDPDLDSIVLSAENVPLNAVFMDSGNGGGSFTFSPDYDQAGVHSVTFIASDGSLADSEVVSITVNNVNRAPVLDSIGSRSVIEGGHMAFLVTASDPDGDSLILSAENVPANAVFADSGNGTGSFEFDPDYTQSGLYYVTFKTSDLDLADSEVVEIMVIDAGNQPPVLDSIGSKTVAETDTLKFRVGATDPDGTIPALFVRNNPANSTFVDSGNGAGAFTFAPNYDQAGVYMVTFVTTDGSLQDSELVEITVTNTDRPPVLDYIGPKVVDEGDTLIFRVQATDPDNDSLILSAENLPSNAIFTDSGNGAGSFEFTPDYTQAELYNVTFIASDGTLADSEAVQITVNEAGNQAPALDSIGAKVVDEGQVLEFRVGATDPDGDSIILSGENVPLNATFVDSGNGAGSFTFNPDYAQAGIFNITFIASDGALADSEVVVITVNDVNRAPILDSIGAKVLEEGQTLEFRVFASDPDGDSIILSAEDAPQNATFTDSGNGAGSFIFTPDFTQSGVYYVTFIVSDGILPDSEVVEITVTESGNHAPELDSIGPQTVVEGDTLEFKIHATDVDLDSIILDALDVPLNATFVDSGNGSGSFIFTPDFTQADTYYVSFIASDGSLADSEVVEITVTEYGNHAPELDSIGPQAVVEGDTLEFRIHATDIDLDSLVLEALDVPLNASFVDSGNGSGSFIFIPDFTQSGVYNITFIASDGSLADSEVVEITVTEFGNHAPVLDSIGPQAVVEGEILELRIHATDIDMDSLILQALDVPVNGSFVDSGNGAGSFIFGPDFTQSGVYYVTFIVSDGILPDSEIVEITVIEFGNHAPELDSIGPQVVVEGDTLEFRIHATDVDLDSIILDALDVPLNVTFTDSGNGAGLFVFTPNFTQADTYYVTFIASDGSLADSEVVEITVTEFGNHAPELDSIGPQVVVEGEILEFRVHATDIDMDSLILDTLDVPLNATFIDSGNGAGSFTFTPDFTQSGVYYVTFIALDGSLADSEVVEITATEFGNHAPVLDSIGPQAVVEGEILELRIHATDIDMDSLILQALDVPVNGSFVDSGNGAGSFIFSPDFTQSGVYYVTFIVSDGILPDSEIVEITVTEFGNHAPVLDSIGPQAVVEGEVLEFRVHATDTDMDSLILQALDVPVNGSFVDSGNGAGSFIFGPDFTQSGVYYVTFIVSDGILPDSEVVEITVTEFGNHAPELDSIGPKIVIEGDTLEFRLHATDVDGDSVILDTLDVPLNGTFIDSGNGAGSFVFTPDFTQADTYYVTFIASDGSLADSEVVEIVVTEFGNHAPELDSIGPKIVIEGDTLEFRLHATDVDGDSIILDTLDVPLNAVFVDSGNGSGSFVFTPDFTQSGVYNITFITSDGSLADSEVVEITVTESGNHAPELDSIGPQTVVEGDILEFRLHATDVDVDSIILDTLDVPLNAVFVDSGNGTGSFSFTPDFTQADTYYVRRTPITSPLLLRMDL
jgi:PKD repeat protein